MEGRPAMCKDCPNHASPMCDLSRCKQCCLKLQKSVTSKRCKKHKESQPTNDVVCVVCGGRASPSCSQTMCGKHCSGVKAGCLHHAARRVASESQHMEVEAEKPEETEIPEGSAALLAREKGWSSGAEDQD
mmetsp:Transcript_80224/g.141945  ORF Transcript_80224/g.141945 Transcript_80224/m.141945 type:complete len:131 (-) Transcript_80224:190-582(-)